MSVPNFMAIYKEKSWAHQIYEDETSMGHEYLNFF